MEFIGTERLILREWTLADVGDQVEGLNNYKTVKNLTAPFPYTEKDSVEYISKHINSSPGDCAFAVVLKENKKVIGGTNISFTNGEYNGGIWLNERYTGIGIGTEVWIARAKFAFEVLNAQVLKNGFFKFNRRSRHMQEKIGYKIVGQKMNYSPALNRRVLEIRTELSRADFESAMQTEKFKHIYDRVKILVKNFWHS